jgi:hypothetical protein
LHTLACREEEAVTQEQGKPDDSAHSHQKSEERDKDVPVWLQIVAGIVAILAFLGIANFHQLATALGWQKTHTASPHPSRSPSASPMAQDTGPIDPQDTGTCTSALSDIQTLQSDVPTYSYTAESQFYIDESMTFYSLERAATTPAFKDDLLDIQGLTLGLGVDYRHEALNDPADDHSASDLSELTVVETRTESFCSQDAGITS